MTIKDQIKESCAKLKAFRKSKKITQQKVGEQMARIEKRKKNYSRSYISLIESGKINISLHVLFTYCDAVGACAEINLTFPRLAKVAVLTNNANAENECWI